MSVEAGSQTRPAWRNAAQTAVAVLLDIAIVYAGYAVALLLRFDGEVPAESWSLFLKTGPALAAGYVGANWLFGVYRTAWQYGGVRDVINLALAVAIITGIIFFANFGFPRRPIPLSVNLIAGGFAFLAMAGAKLRPRIWTRGFGVLAGHDDMQRVLVVGAGDIGQLMVHEFIRNPGLRYRPVCFVDDDSRKQGQLIHGIPVVGRRSDIPALVSRYRVDLIALAFAARGGSFRELLAVCQGTGLPVRIVPGLADILSGSGELREVTVDDLLNREPIEIDYAQCSRTITGRVVLITGGAGSIGSELARQILGLNPSALHLLDNNETGLHDLGQELESQSDSAATVKLWVSDVSERSRLEWIMKNVRPEVIFHAAAYKHVPLMEEHPHAALRVNLLGTLNLCQLAHEAGAGKFVFISSDKAVQPSSVMGATKRLSELVVRSLAREGRTSFCAVRFGNVMGSRGSVIPIFWRQIEKGGPISITHPDVTRYFMTVPEAVSLIIQAAAFASPGQLFMLNMGEEVRIVDLAEKMIRLRGLDPREIGVVYTGLRPGEKLQEDLTGEGERLAPTSHRDVLLVESEVDERLSSQEVLRIVADLLKHMDDEPEALAQRLLSAARGRRQASQA